MSDKGNQGEWPTNDELIEAVSLGCMVCGEPGSELAVEGQLVGKRTGYINPDTGEIVWGDINAEHKTESIYCSRCGETIWKR